jgi:ABC-type nitrate/sulfonate/bicarbonate transport system substrate-binding protein
MRGRNWSSAIGVVAAAALMAAGCGGDDEAASSGSASGGKVKSTVTVGMQAPLIELPAMYGQQQGFFKQQGISSLKFVSFSQPPAMMAAVAKGQVDVGNQTLVVLNGYNATSGGDKLKFFAPSNMTAFTWVANNEAGVTPASGSDWKQAVATWKGKTVGVAALGGILDAATRYTASQAGLEEGKDYEIRAAGVGAQAVGALKAGVVDVFAAEPFTAASIEAGKIGQTVLSVPDGEGPPEFQGTFGGAYFAPETGLTENAATYRAFAAALEDSRKAFVDPANKAEVVRTIASTLQVDPALAEAYYPSAVKIFDADLSEETVARTADVGVEVGLVKEPAPGYDDLVAQVEPAS